MPGDQGSVPLIMLIRFMPMVNKIRNELTKNF